jgi:hypothetical protein
MKQNVLRNYQQLYSAFQGFAMNVASHYQITRHIDRLSVFPISRYKILELLSYPMIDNNLDTYRTRTDITLDSLRKWLYFFFFFLQNQCRKFVNRWISFMQKINALSSIFTVFPAMVHTVIYKAKTYTYILYFACPVFVNGTLPTVSRPQ